MSEKRENTYLKFVSYSWTAQLIKRLLWLCGARQGPRWPLCSPRRSCWTGGAIMASHFPSTTGCSSCLSAQLHIYGNGASVADGQSHGGRAGA